MDLISLVETALRDGCGVSLSDALESERYKQLLEREKTLASKYTRRSHRGLAYRTGHLHMGRLLNTLPERDALTEARRITYMDSADTEIRALVWYVGEQLIAAAEKCLPDEAIDMAKDWRAGDVKAQIDIAKRLYYLLRGEDIEEVSKLEFTWDSWPEYLQNRLHEKLKQPPNRILPNCYGKWGQGGDPNCQGKSQMFAAFARLAGARTYAVEPLVDTGMTKDKWRRHVYQVVEEDLVRRKIKHVDKKFRESFDVASLRHSFEQYDHSFHVCIAMQLGDGQWVLVDPHALSWGVLSPHYDMGRIDRLLSKYREVLPGLGLIGSDTDTEGQLFQQHMQGAEQWLGRSRKMQEVIEREDQSPSAIIHALAKSGDAVAIARAFSIDSKMLELIDQMGEEGLQYLATMMFWQTSDPWNIIDQAPQILGDPEFLDKKVDSLLTAYHCIVLNLFRDQVSHDGLLVHPVCEFRNTEYDLALAAISSLRLEGSSPSETRFFLDHQFSQISLSNALHELGVFSGFGAAFNRERDHSLGVAAARVLQALPVRHPICDWKLSIAASLLKEDQSP